MSLISYHNVEIHRKEHVVLKDITFSVDRGEFVYLIGKVGSGKSSLLKSMYAEVPVSAGEATVLDYDLTSIRRRDIPYLRRRVGIVFQDFQLLTDRTVYSNLDFVLRATGWDKVSERDERIDAVLSRVGMAKKSYKMPHELSGGEQQRVVIARALLNDPDIVLADEPTGNLDPDTSAAIVSHLHDIASKGTAVIMATHNHALLDTMPGRTLRIDAKHLSAD